MDHFSFLVVVFHRSGSNRSHGRRCIESRPHDETVAMRRLSQGPLIGHPKVKGIGIVVLRLINIHVIQGRLCFVKNVVFYVTWPYSMLHGV